MYSQIHNQSQHLQMQIQANSVIPGTNGFINFWLGFFDMKRETQFLLCSPYYLTPPTFGTSCDVLRSLSEEIWKAQLHLQWAKSNSQLNGRELNSLPAWSNLSFSTAVFFLNPQILSLSLLGMMSSTLQPHFLSGVYYDNGDCHILCMQA